MGCQNHQLGGLRGVMNGGFGVALGGVRMVRGWNLFKSISRMKKFDMGSISKRGTGSEKGRCFTRTYETCMKGLIIQELTWVFPKK